jgi:hypothetical protein
MKVRMTQNGILNTTTITYLRLTVKTSYLSVFPPRFSLNIPLRKFCLEPFEKECNHRLHKEKIDV